MIKKALLSLSAIMAISSGAMAQVDCATDKVNNDLKAKYPQIATLEAQMEAEIAAQMKNFNVSAYARANGITNHLDQKYIIPVAVHVIHDYGSEYISDDQIYRMIEHTNDLYLKRTADSNNLINPYKFNIPGTTHTYFAKTNIEFRLANRDPLGQPSHGITRRRSALTSAAGDQAKYDIWPPDSYINIWLVAKFNGNHNNAGAYAYKPASGASLPFYDGIIGLAGQTSGTGSYTLGHELGHVLNLDHPWGATNEPEVDCAGSDNVDDTPPTRGHNSANGFTSCLPSQAAPTFNRTRGTGTGFITGPTVLGTIWDTLCIHKEIAVGRAIITNPAATAVSSTSVVDGITFQIYTATTIKSLNVYPSTSANRGDTFALEIRNVTNNNLVTSYTGVVDTPYNTNSIALPVVIDQKFTAGVYKITFTRNPGMLRGPAVGINSNTEGAMVIKELDTIGNKGYPFFYDFQIRHGYFKIYDKAQISALYDSLNLLPSVYFNPQDSSKFLVDYPDTVNVQNVMDYAFCDFMFTRGQALRMRASLNSTVAGRKNLWSAANLAYTGVNQPRPDLKPIPDFSAARPFLCANVANSGVTFSDKSWNDTITALNWKFSNSPSVNNATGPTIANVRFDDPGFVDVTLTATGNNTGDSTVTKSDRVYAADPNPIDINTIQEFDGNLDKWPTFNYFGGKYAWERANVGYYDNSSIKFTNFDNRITGIENVDAPDGVYSDIYTPAYDFTAAGTDDYYATFVTSNATRSYLLSDMRDGLYLQYSNDCGVNWITLDSLVGNKLANVGTLTTQFVPGYRGDWKSNSIKLANGHPARTARTYFRFRYIARTDNGPDYQKQGSGNNFYMDRFYFTTNKLGVSNSSLEKNGFAVVPNPTHGSANVVLEGGTGVAQVMVTDVTGKLVYQVTQQLQAGTTQVAIPADRLSARGLYLVKVITDNKSMTEKLVVN